MSCTNCRTAHQVHPCTHACVQHSKQHSSRRQPHAHSLSQASSTADQASAQQQHTLTHLTTLDTPHTPLLSLVPSHRYGLHLLSILIPLCAIITINIFLAVLVIALQTIRRRPRRARSQTTRRRARSINQWWMTPHPDTPIRQNVCRSYAAAPPPPNQEQQHTALNTPHTHTPSSSSCTAHAQVCMLITDRFIIAHTNKHDHYDVQDLPRPDRGEVGWPVNLANKDNDYMDSGWYVPPPQHRALLCTHHTAMCRR